MKSFYFITAILCLLSIPSYSQSCEILFEDDFETGSFSDQWTLRPNLEGSAGIIDISSAVGNGDQFGVRIGRSTDGGADFTLNGLDLSIDLSGQQGKDINLTFDLLDFYDENHLQDGLYFSDDGGINFQQAFRFYPEQWCNDRYGDMPNIDVDAIADELGLQLNSSFVIRWQQFDNSNFSTGGDEDGYYLDRVKITAVSTAQQYASIPFCDDFETGVLNCNWKFSNPSAMDEVSEEEVSPLSLARVVSGSGLNSEYAVAIGRAGCDGLFNATTLDLFLNASEKEQLELNFSMRDYYEETHNLDGIWFSDDGGSNFQQVLRFTPELWCNNRWGTLPPIDVDILASNVGLVLSDRFVIRFLLYDNANFSTGGDEDGIYIDNICITEPDYEYATLPLTDNFEDGILNNWWRWSWADSTTLPAVDITSIDGRVRIINNFGFESQFSLWMGKGCDGNFAANAVDLGLNLANETEVEMTFQIYDFGDETHIQDGIYMSDNGGQTFTKVLDFTPQLWCTEWGTFPPIDIDALADANNLELTSTFIIRFQQYDNADFNTSGDEDGMYIDNVQVYVPNHQFIKPDIVADFETGELPEFMRISPADNTALPATDVTSPGNIATVFANNGQGGSQFSLYLGKNCDTPNIFTTNALDICVDLSGCVDLELSYWLYDFGDETHIQDGIFFSQDGGQNFTKVYDFTPEEYPNQYNFYNLDLDQLITQNGLEPSNQFIIRFQQHDNSDFGTSGDEDGFILDNIAVSAAMCGVSSLSNQMVSSKVQLYPNPVKEDLQIVIQNLVPQDQIRKIQVLNLRGEIIKEIVTDKQFEASYNLSFRNQSNGVYIVRILINEEWLARRVIKIE